MVAFYIDRSKKLRACAAQTIGDYVGFNIPVEHHLIAVQDENNQLIMPALLEVSEFEKLYLNNFKTSQYLKFSHLVEFRKAGFRVAASVYLAETLTYRDRVTADGGTIQDLNHVDIIYRKLKELNLLDMTAFYHYKAGVKKDSTGAISKLYSLDSSANDVIQTTGAAQPKFTTNGLEFASGMYLHAHGNTSFNINTTIPLSEGFEGSVKDLTTNKCAFTNMMAETPHEGYGSALGTDGKIHNYQIKTWTTDALSEATGINNYAANENFNFSTLFDGAKKATGLKLYKNGVEQATVITYDNLVTDLIGKSIFTIGGRWNTTNNELVFPFVGFLKKIYMWKKQITTAQLNEVIKL